MAVRHTVRVIFFSPVSIIPLLAHFYLHVALTRGARRAKSVNLTNSSVLPEMGERWIEKCLYVVSEGVLKQIHF